MAAFLLPDRTHVLVAPHSEGTLSFTHERIQWQATISPAHSWSAPTVNNDSISFKSVVEGQPTNPDFVVYSTLYYYFNLPRPDGAVESRPGAPRQKWTVSLNTSVDPIDAKAAHQFYSKPAAFYGESVFALAHPSGLKKLCVSDVFAFLESKGLVFWLPDGPEDQLVPRITQSAFWQLDAGFITPPLSEFSPGASGPNSLRYKPTAAVYIFTHGVRHPIRPRTGFAVKGNLYQRYIPQLRSILTLRLASVDDTALVNKWMNNPRVNHFWGEKGDLEATRRFLERGLSLRHSFPVIGSWEGVSGEGQDLAPSGVVEPFGYFEIYWVKEDTLGRYTDADHWDRGVHLLVGEEKFRGPQRVRAWLGSVVHYMFLDDARTQTVMLEPRIDNEKLRNYLFQEGFYKEKEITFPHKQSALMKLKREAWEGPEL